MTTVIDGAAGFRRVMNGAEVLPFAGAHLGTGRGRTGWVIVEKGEDEMIDFLGSQPTQLI